MFSAISNGQAQFSERGGGRGFSATSPELGVDGRGVESGARLISASFKFRLRVTVVKKGISRFEVAWDPEKAEKKARGEMIVNDVEDATDGLFDWPGEEERAADNM